jgi:hypothetical protein
MEPLKATSNMKKKYLKKKNQTPNLFCLVMDGNVIAISIFFLNLWNIYAYGHPTFWYMFHL